MQGFGTARLEELLHALGEQLSRSGSSVSIVVAGGAALSVLGWVKRTTKDVDVIALAEKAGGDRKLIPPDPTPEELQKAILRVARDFGLPEDWMNMQIGAQWQLGLPPSILRSVEWRSYGPLEVGFVGREGLMYLKLFAAVDQGVTSVHYQDLLTLQPSEEELEAAAAWVRTQDAGEPFAELVDEVVRNVREALA